MHNSNLIKELREKTGAGMLDCKKALEASNQDIENAITWLREKGISKAAKKAERIAGEGVSKILIEGNNAIILEVNSETDFVAKNEEFKKFVDLLAETLIKSDAKTMEEAENLNIDGETIKQKIIAITSKIGEKISFRRFEKLSKNDNEEFGEYIHMGGKIASLIVLEADKEIAKDVAMHVCAMNPTYISETDVTKDVIEKERKIFKEQSINEGKSPEIAEKMVEGRIKKYLKEICLEEQPFVKDPSLSVKQYIKNSKITNMIRYEVGEGIEKRSENFADEVQKQINNN